MENGEGTVACACSLLAAKFRSSSVAKWVEIYFDHVFGNTFWGDFRVVSVLGME